MSVVLSKLGIKPAILEPVTAPFGEWLPDVMELNSPGATEALNVVPIANGYGPFCGIRPIGTLTVPSAVHGGLTLYDKDEGAKIYVGTVDGIYSRQDDIFVQLQTATGLSAEFLWQFIQFGDNVVALHPNQSPQVAAVDGVSAFSPLGGSPPIAACGARVGDFLVLGNLIDVEDPDDDDRPARIRWSGFNNIEAPWITDPATQADFNDMPAEGGPVVAIAGREYGTVFQRRMISRMTYTGLPAVFDIQTVEEERGALSIGSVVDLGNLVYFISDDGFFIWNGTNATPIGDDRVNQYFFKKLAWTQKHRIVGALDFNNKCVVWAFPTTTSGVLDELLMFSFRENKFTHARLEVEFLLATVTPATSLDTMDGDLDTDYNISFDSNIYAGGVPYMAGFDTTHTFGVFDGAFMEATIDTALYNEPTGERIWINNTRPLIDVSTAVCTVSGYGRDQLLGQAASWSTPVVQEITGEAPLLVDGRYIKLRVVVPTSAEWSFGTGVEIWRNSTGRA